MPPPHTRPDILKHHNHKERIQEFGKGVRRGEGGGVPLEDYMRRKTLESLPKVGSARPPPPTPTPLNPLPPNSATDRGYIIDTYTI